MNVKNIAISTFLAGILILILILMVVIILVKAVIPADMSRYCGMRESDHPVMILFFFCPFVVAFTAAILFDTFRSFLAGTPLEKRLLFGALLLTILLISSLQLMIT